MVKEKVEIAMTSEDLSKLHLKKFANTQQQLSTTVTTSTTATTGTASTTMSTVAASKNPAQL